jgi:hypothetical protein
MLDLRRFGKKAIFGPRCVGDVLEGNARGYDTH